MSRRPGNRLILLTVWFGIPIALRQGQEDRA